MAKPKRVEIIIQKGNYDPSHKNGRGYVSVDFMASRYGRASPCDSEEEVKDAITSCKKWIIEEGDIPIIKDLRNAPNLTQQTLFSEINNKFKQLKGGLKCKMEIQNKIEEYASLLDQIKTRIQDSNEAVVILEQIGKDKRTELIQGLQNSNSDTPATEKQKKYMDSLGIEYSDDVTKKDASGMIEQNC